MLERQPAWIGRAGSHGRTLLWEAAYRGRLAMADIDACGCHFTPLLVEISPCCAARCKGHDAVAERLLARGAATDIYTAAFLGDTGAVSEYLDADSGLARAEKGQHNAGAKVTVLHYAVSAGHLHIVRMLLARGADPRPCSGWLIRFAVRRERADILEALLEVGADPSRVEIPRSGVTDAGILEVLARHGVRVDVNQAEGGWPPWSSSRGATGEATFIGCAPCSISGPMSMPGTTRARRPCTARPGPGSTGSSPCCWNAGPTRRPGTTRARRRWRPPCDRG